MFDWFQLAKEKEQKTIQIRRYLHQHPELSFEEHQTAAYIIDQLSKLNCEVQAPIARNGIIATFEGSGEGPTIALRADFDALPIVEETGLPFQSQNKGGMHACGHDGHTAILLTVAEIIDAHREYLKGNVVLVFQYGEEVMPGGAQEIIDTGCLRHVDRIYGNHLWSGYPTGTINSKPGAMMASPDEFNITIHGKGGHGAKPHETIDPVVVMAEFIMSAQKIVSRTIDPVKQAVITFGMIQAGNADNVIPNSAFCRGTVRTFDTEVQSHIIERIEKLLEGLAVANDITYDLDYIRGYLPVHNHGKSYEVVKQAANDMNLRFSESELMMIGEDFSHYQKVLPGAFFLTGCGNEQKGTTYPHHSPQFDVDESSFKYAVSEFMKILELEGVIAR
ncbi:amidohydrolase [Staphylococcus auricularis]|uniref:Amidohydrolase n=1 Tax=Staphylococcus auricularis TaxID=29379 RepID=A0AAP8TT21_9STAP|nr:M20 family metallopeptidase [Staphylococcus auricularis]PNZ67324.1 amidohydrolase [Staphylococcus auricularis]QPT06417.1 amidohydrolase [Staphylococcus auricularis]BCU53180.1 amidohydrolase [Staphylococcus auricularis]SQJ16438.1 peptidase [Staphylococcus auricularis]